MKNYPQNTKFSNNFKNTTTAEFEKRGGGGGSSQSIYSRFTNFINKLFSSPFHKKSSSSSFVSGSNNNNKINSSISATMSLVPLNFDFKPSSVSVPLSQTQETNFKEKKQKLLPKSYFPSYFTSVKTLWNFKNTCKSSSLKKTNKNIEAGLLCTYSLLNLTISNINSLFHPLNQQVFNIPPGPFDLDYLISEELSKEEESHLKKNRAKAAAAADTIKACIMSIPFMGDIFIKPMPDTNFYNNNNNWPIMTEQNKNMNEDIQITTVTTCISTEEVSFTLAASSSLSSTNKMETSSSSSCGPIVSCCPLKSSLRTRKKTESESSTDSWIEFSVGEEVYIIGSPKSSSLVDNIYEDSEIDDDDDDETASIESDNDSTESLEDDSDCEYDFEDIIEPKKEEDQLDCSNPSKMLKVTKRVHFNELNLVQVIEFVDDEESKAMRNNSSWYTDKLRFKERIRSTEEKLSPIFDSQHREKIFNERISPKLSELSNFLPKKA